MVYMLSRLTAKDSPDSVEDKTLRYRVGKSAQVGLEHVQSKIPADSAHGFPFLLAISSKFEKLCGSTTKEVVPESA